MARKKRDYENPCRVSLKTSDDRVVSIEVADYSVTQTHVVLKRKEDGSVRTKYVAIGSLKSFEFDEPEAMAMARTRRQTVAPAQGVASTGPVMTNVRDMTAKWNPNSMPESLPDEPERAQVQPTTQPAPAPAPIPQGPSINPDSSPVLKKVVDRAINGKPGAAFL